MANYSNFAIRKDPFWPRTGISTIPYPPGAFQGFSFSLFASSSCSPFSLFRIPRGASSAKDTCTQRAARTIRHRILASQRSLPSVSLHRCTRMVVANYGTSHSVHAREKHETWPRDRVCPFFSMGINENALRRDVLLPVAPFVITVTWVPFTWLCCSWDARREKRSWEVTMKKQRFGKCVRRMPGFVKLICSVIRK